MIIYNKITLQNIFIKRQAAQAFAEGEIDKETFEKIKVEHPSGLYSPNAFVAIGLGLLTLLIACAAAGLGALMFSHLFSSGILFVLFGALCYLFLEMMCRRKKHKDSGVDMVLMAATALSIAAGFSILLDPRLEDLFISFVLFVILAWFAYRFVNILAGAVAAVCLLVFTFNSYSALGQFTIFSFPYVLMVVAAVLYFIGKRQTTCNSFFVHYPVFTTVKMIGLFAFYFSGNYYVVDKIIEQNYLLNAQSALSQAWLFWCWTFGIPVLYLIAGIKRKDILLVRSGVLLIVLSVLTFRYYHAIISPEAGMITAGILFIGTGYFLMRTLRNGKYGFEYKADAAGQSKYKDAEAFALSQVLSPQAIPEPGTKFGGGSFGGAGSGSDY